MSPVVVLIEHDRGVVAETATQALTAAAAVVDAGGASAVHAVVIGSDADPSSTDVAAHGVETVWHVRHPELVDYAPEAWGDALAQLARSTGASAVLATGTDRGNEVLAHVAASLDLPLATNVTAFSAGEREWALTRARWGGSLLEHATISAQTILVTTAPHAFAAPSAEGSPAVRLFDAELDTSAVRTRVVDRVTLASGITLTTAPVVVSGGRGVGSPEGFAVLEELAGLLGGAVGCSRVVTNNGWRPHADQVGQTGKRVAPELYIACGISGAIQHWVGMMAAKKVLAINTDRDANMVAKADYAVIGDLHEVLPALIAELRARKG